MHRGSNGLKTAILFAALGAFFLFVGRLVGGTTGMTIALVLALGINAFAYFNSDKIALRSMQAQPASEAQFPVLYSIVRDLANSANPDRPRSG